MGYKVQRYNAISFFYVFESSYFQREAHISPWINSSSKEDRHLTRDASILRFSDRTSAALSRPALFSR